MGIHANPHGPATKGVPFRRGEAVYQESPLFTHGLPVRYLAVILDREAAIRLFG
jgi:hypothetical protein